MDNQIKPLFEPQYCDRCGLHKNACRDIYGSGRFIPTENHKLYCVNCTEGYITDLHGYIDKLLKEQKLLVRLAMNK